LESFEEDTQVFIVRFWNETREKEGACPIWRGSVEHVSSGRRIYVNNIEEIGGVVSSFVRGTEMNGKVSGWKKRLKSGLLKKKRT
jgi:hypothetical protein